MNFSNLTKKFWFKTISLIIIQTFFILDVAWAGGTELNLQKNSDTLSAPIQISQQAFNANFEKFYETKLGKTPVQQTVKQKISKISWNPNAKFQKVKNAIIANISQIAKKIMNLRLNPALASLLLTPAFIAFNHKLGWAEDGTIVDSLNWLKEFIIDRWIISLLIGTLVVGMIIIGSIVGWDAIKAQLFESRVRREEKRDVELAGGEKVVKEKIMQKTDNKDLVSWWYIVEAARFINKHGYFNVEDGEEEYDPRTNTHSNDNCPDNYDIFGSGYPCPQCENQLDDSHLEIRRTIKIVLKSILLPIILASAILAQSSELGWAGDRIGEVTSWFVGITSSQYGLGVLLVLIALLSLDFLLYRYFSTKIKQWVLNLKKKSKDEYPRKLEGQARGTVQKMFDFLGKVSQRRTIENADLASADAMIVFGHYDLRIPEEAAMYADFADTIVTVGNVGVYSEHIFNEPEAIKFKKIMVELGVPEDKIITEPDSTNTLENLNNTFAIFKKKGITPKKIILMANPLHQTRAIATARRYYPDVEYIPYAAYTLDIETMSEDKLIEMLCFGLREIRQLTHYDKENWISLTQVERDGLADIRGILEVSKDEIDAFLGFPIDDKQKVNAKVRSIADKNYAPLIQLQERLEDYKEELNELEAVKKLFIQEDKDTEALDLQISELKKKIADIRIEQIAQKLINQGVYKKADPNLPSKQELFALIDETVEVLKSEETEGLLRERIDQIKSDEVFRQGHVVFIPELDEKMIVVTDLHGDLTSLNNILKETDFENNMESKNPNMRLVFLGDYINGGTRSLGTLIRVMQLKMKYPKHVVLLRGNGEELKDITVQIGDFWKQEKIKNTPEANDRMLKKFGYIKKHSHFPFELVAQYGLNDADEIYDRLLKFFELMPSLVVTKTGIVMSHSAPPHDPRTTLLDIENSDELAYELRRNSTWTDKPSPNEVREDKNDYKKCKIREEGLKGFLNTIGGNIYIGGHVSLNANQIQYNGKMVVLHSQNTKSPDSGHKFYQNNVSSGSYGVLDLNKEYDVFTTNEMRSVPYANNPGNTASDILAEYEKDINERRGLARLVGKEFDLSWQIETLKFDEDGEMLQFSGLTAISWIAKQSPLYQKLGKLQDRIKERLEEVGMGDVIAYLDKASFHMTVTGIDPVKKKEQRHLYGKEKISFEQYQQRLAQVKEAFDKIGAPGKITARVQGVGLGKTVTAMVRFDDAKELKKVQDVVSEINHKTGVKKLFSGHISLGYMVKEPKDYQKFIQILQECEKEFGKDQYIFDSFDYTYFPDMKTFTPILTKDLETGEVIDHVEKIAQELINQGVYKKADPNLPSKQELFALIDETVEVLKSEETEGLLRERIDQIKSDEVFRQGHVVFIPELDENVCIIGDLHGDMISLNNILEKTGFIINMESGNPNIRLIVLGDYINNGTNSLGVLLRLMELKIKYPEHVILLRGNNEVQRDDNKKIGAFHKLENLRLIHDKQESMLNKLGYLKQNSFFVFELVAKYGLDNLNEIYEHFMQLFELLPGTVVTAKGLVMTHAAPPKDPNVSLLDIAKDNRIAFEMRKSSIFADEDPPRNKDEQEEFKKNLLEKTFLSEFLNKIGGRILITGHFSTQSGWVYFGKRVVLHSCNVKSPESGYYLYYQGVGDGCYTMLPLNKEYDTFKEEYLTPVPYAKEKPAVSSGEEPMEVTEELVHNFIQNKKLVIQATDNTAFLFTLIQKDSNNFRIDVGPKDKDNVIGHVDLSIDSGKDVDFGIFCRFNIEWSDKTWESIYPGIQAALTSLSVGVAQKAGADTLKLEYVTWEGPPDGDWGSWFLYNDFIWMRDLSIPPKNILINRKFEGKPGKLSKTAEGIQPQHKETAMKIEKDGRLIGAVVRSDHNPGETTHRFTNMEDPIQFNVMSRKAGIKGEKVYHTPVEGPNPFGDRPRQEVLFILKGKIKATFSTKENETVTEEILEAGDSVLFTEGHQVEFLEDTVFLEAKQGPYPSSGNKNDDQVMLSDNPESIYNELFSAGNSVELLKKLEKTKLAVFDLDETLANVDKDVPAGTIEELKSLLEKEINIAIVTGAGKFRVMPRLINKLKQSLGKDKLGLLQNLRVYTRLGNAGFGFNEAGEEVDLEETAIPDYQIENIKKIITASAEEIGIGEGINYKLTYKKEAKGNTLIVRIGFDDLANKKGDMHKMAQEIRKMFESEEIKLKVIESGEVAVEIAVNGKDYAIASLMDKLGVLADEIAFFGDSFGLNGGDRAMRFDATLKSLFFNVGPDIEEQELNEGILTSKVKGPSATEKILKLLIISKEQKIKDQIKKTPLKIDLKESLFNAKLREMVDMAI